MSAAASPAAAEFGGPPPPGAVRPPGSRRGGHRAAKGKGRAGAAGGGDDDDDNGPGSVASTALGPRPLRDRIARPSFAFCVKCVAEAALRPPAAAVPTIQCDWDCSNSITCALCKRDGKTCFQVRDSSDSCLIRY